MGLIFVYRKFSNSLYPGSCRLYSGSCRLYSGSCRLYSGSCRLYQQQKWTTCPVKIAIFRGLGGVPKFNFHWNPLFLLLRNPCKNLKSYDNPFWGKSKEGKKKEKKTSEKIPKIMAYLSCSAKLLVARNTLRPIFLTIF